MVLREGIDIVITSTNSQQPQVMDNLYSENGRVCVSPVYHCDSWWLCNVTSVIVSGLAISDSTSPLDDTTSAASASVSCWNLLLPANNSLFFTLTSSITVMFGLVFNMVPEYVLTTFHRCVHGILSIDPLMVEQIMHLILVMVSLIIILLIFIMYFCLILLEGKHQNTLKPIKVIVPEEEKCNPACTKDHEHTFRR